MNCKKLFCDFNNHLLSKIRNTNIFSRLIISFFMISFIPLFLTTMLSVNISTSTVKNKLTTYSVQMMKQLSTTIHNELFRLENDAVAISFSDTVQLALKHFDEMSEFEKYKVKEELHKNIAKQFTSINHVSDVILCTTDLKLINAYGGTNCKFTLDEKTLNSIVNKTKLREGEPVYTVIYDYKKQDPNYFFQDDTQLLDRTGILLTKQINNLNTSKIIGYIIIRFDEAYFSNMYSQLNFDDNTLTFMINSSGTIISSIDKKQVGNSSPYPDIINKIKLHKNTNSFSYKYHGNSYWCTFSPIPSTDIYLVSLISEKYFHSQTIDLVLLSLLTAFISFVIAFIFAITITSSISKPLNKLILSMNKVKEGDLRGDPPDNSKDELAIVQNNFNELVKKLSQSIETIKYNEREKRKLQFKSLQSQINPHFLSNTLNTLKWLASIQNAKNIEELASALIDIINQAMGKGGEWTSIDKEINVLKSYITVQSYRYFDKFRVIFEVEDDILKYSIPKFLIQPILENAIIHGTMDIDHLLTIIVKGFIGKDNVITLSIMDDGCGIDQQKLETILCSLDNRCKNPAFNSIGLSNVNERIKLFYGDSYGLTVNSIKNVFTKIEIIFPKKII